MHVDLDRQPRVQNHFDGGVEISQIFLAAVVMPGCIHHRLRVHAEPHMIEARRLDQRNVGRRGPGLRVFFRVSLRIINLREPGTQIDPVPNVRQTRRRNRGEWRTLRQ